MSGNPPISLKDVLHRSTWETQASGALIGSFSANGIATAFTEQDLAELHPDLPSATRLQLKRMSGHTLAGLNITCQLHYLTQALLLLPESPPGELHYAVTLENLFRTPTPGKMLLSATMFRVIATEEAPFVWPDSLTIRGYILPFAWFDARFPGWQPRFDTAEFLGLSGEDLIAHVLTTEPAVVLPEASIEGVAFD